MADPITLDWGLPLKVWEYPQPQEIAATVEDFLRQLAGPTLIRLRGYEEDRTRVVVTLLHGNEPSGVIAIHKLLREGFKPLVNCEFLIVCVKTALLEPIFSNRFIAPWRDMNRCFKPPYEDPQGKLAEAILHYLSSREAEAVIDIHNTSGNGPSFAVCCHQIERSFDIASLFTERLISTHHRIGALMERDELGYPIVTIECGGAGQAASHQLAESGLRRFLTEHELYHVADHSKLDLYPNPVRLELLNGTRICYADAPDASADITLARNIDALNFGVVDSATPLAWLNQGARCYRMVNEMGVDCADDFVEVRGNQLFPKGPMKLFMVTTNPVIAKSDCLFYAVKEQDHQTLFA